jgi:hypothetical protein
MDQQITINAPLAGKVILLVLAIPMFCLSLYLAHKYTLTHENRDILCSLISLGVFIGSMTSGLSSVSQKITLSSEYIKESTMYGVKHLLLVDKITGCNAEKRMIYRAWVGVFHFKMEDGSMEQIRVAAKNFYWLKEELKKRYDFCHWN